MEEPKDALECLGCGAYWVPGEPEPELPCIRPRHELQPLGHELVAAGIDFLDVRFSHAVDSDRLTLVEAVLATLDDADRFRAWCRERQIVVTGRTIRVGTAEENRWWKKWRA